MSGAHQVRFGLVLALVVLTGCGQQASETPAPPAGPAPNNGANTTAIDSQAIARAATSFMQAVLKGDSQSASALLTPQAIERIIATNTQFNPSGIQTATFELGEIRTPAQGQAIVQFMLTDSISTTAEKEEGCCLMKKVGNEWRVSGIAYGQGPNLPWTLSDFETGQSTHIRRPPSRSKAVEQELAARPGGRPSPPRTPEETAPSTLR
jgi:hypothetical protein